MSRTAAGDRVRSDLVAALRVCGFPAWPSSGDGESSFRFGGDRRLAELADLLYSRWFCRAGEAVAGGPPAPSLPTLAARLRAAHAATGRFEAGWRVETVGAGGWVTAARGGERISLLPPDYVNTVRPAAPVRVGQSIAVTARRDDVDPESHWWVTVGSAGDAPRDAMARVYWNCPHDLAEDLVAGVTAELENRRLPYSMKCPATAELFDRVDSAVVYLSIRGWAEAKVGLRKVHAALADRLREDVPRLTLPLGRGVAVAEDPDGGESFGQSRARAVAEGILLAADSRLTDERAVLTLILDRLAAHDVSPTRPYLRRTSAPDRVTTW